MNIEIKLNKNFSTNYDRLIEEYGEEFADLNGLSEEKLSFTDFIDNFSAKKTVADASVDGSSNVKNKDIVTLRSEMCKPHEKLLAYNKIFLEMNRMFGLRKAKKWMELEWNRALYLHDANSSTFVPYCFAYDLTKLAKEGLFYLDYHNKPEPAKHLETFVDFVKEFINFASNRTSGACGLPNLIPYMYYYWYNDVKSGHYPRCHNEEQFAKSHIQRLIYAFNQPYTRDGVQSAFVNTSIFDSEYFDALFGGAEFPDGEFMIDHKDGILLFQKWFLEEMADIKDRGRMFTFPVNSISLLKENGKFKDEEFARWACNHNRRWNDSNIFADKDVTSLSNCCRLKSNIKDIGYFNSIGGSALKVGSIKVSTVNLARIGYECNGDEKKFLKILKDRLQINMEVLHVIRHIIKKNVAKNFLPNFQEGIIDFEHLYNTVGVNGIYEVMKTLGYTTVDELGYTYYTDDAMRFGKDIFDVIHQSIQAFVEDKDYMVNVEQIPGETAALRFLQADKLLFPDQVVTDLPLYGNQWIPLGIKTTLKERVRICAKFDDYCNGGSICHINLDAPIENEEMAWDILNYVTDQGVTYSAMNGNISSCDNGHLFHGNICPKCGEHKTSEYTRTVGFYTEIASWSKERKEEYKLRDWHPLNEKGIDG
jgi:ribonucleoside-triphosphate reductase